MQEFKLPDVGEGLTEAEIVAWRVAEGDVVDVNDVLVDIETAKSIVELPSPFAGTVHRLMVEEGATVAVGTPIVAIGEEAEAGVPGRGRQDEAGVPGPGRQDDTAHERQPVLVGYGPRTGSVERRARKGRHHGRAESVTPVMTSRTLEPLRALAKPPVRKLAKDLGVDLRELAVDGHVITREDVQSHVAPPAPADGTRTPVKGVRKATAEAMLRSASTAVHVTEWVTVDVSRTVELVERMKADRAFADVKVSPLVLVARAVCLALGRTPGLHSRWVDEPDGAAIERPDHVGLGIAAATDRGLVVPVVAAADTLSTHDLAAALGELVDVARAGRTQPAQMSGGTFTITNVGVFGVDGGTPILTPGQTGILAVGAIARRPWVADDDTVVPRWVTTLALSFDHRVVDGAEGSTFLADVAALLHDPALALTF